jgi:serine/threonine-protein kinase OSR1/STK39
MVEKKEAWPSKATGFKLISAIGSGSFGLVWRAQCIQSGSHLNKMVAIKIIDLEFQDSSITELRKEISIMSTSQHKNIVPEYVSFVDKHFLWIVMPVMDAGSC